MLHSSGAADADLRSWLENFLISEKLERKTPTKCNFKKWLRSFLVSQTNLDTNEIVELPISGVPHPIVINWQSLDQVLQAQTAQRASPSPINVWSLARLGRNELRIAHIVAWLLSPVGSHGQGAAFLKAFVELLNARSGGKKISSDNFEKSSVRTEEYPIGSAEDRVDIEIIGDNFLLIVEIKVEAPEGARQLERYVSLARLKANAIQRQTFRLALLGNKKPSLEDEHLTWITWREFSRLIKAASLDMLKANLAKQLVVQFAAHAMLL